MSRCLFGGWMYRVSLLVGLALVGLPAGSASADTTIGQLGGDFGGFGVIEGADLSYVVPAGGGTITSFSFQSDPADRGVQVDFMVLRPVPGPYAYTVLGKTGVVTLTGASSGTTVETFRANIPVRGGDILGLWTHGRLDNIGMVYSSTSVPIPSCGGPSCFWFGQDVPDPNVGDGVVFGVGGGLHLNESADLVPPLPTSEQQCRQNGWKSFGPAFRNQGQCVSFVATRGKHSPAGS